MNYDYLHPRDEIALTISRIYRNKMTTMSGGNLSILDENGDMWITPAGIDKGTLTPADIVCVRHDGTVEGRHRPSSEYPFHRAIYDVRPDLTAVVHAHPMALVAFSIAKRVPNTRIIPQTYRWNGKVAFAPYGVPGSDDLGSKIAEKFAAGYDSVMLESHGVCCGGRTLQDAFQRFETLELCARTEIKASQLGTPQFLTEEQLQLESRSDLRLATFEHGPENMTVAEKNLRNQVCAFIGRGYRQGLFTGATGTISARLDANSFLITPHPLDRFSVLPEELVLVRNGRCEAGKTPSYAALAHRTIYEAHPDVGSVVNANASNCLAFSVCNKAIDTRTLPESYILLREVSLLPFETTFSNMAKMASTLSLRHPAAVLANNGVLVVGSDVVSVFDKLEVLDSTAEAILGSLPIGGYVPIGKDAIDDIVKAFKLPK